MEDHINLLELIELSILLGLPVTLIARLIQFLYLKPIPGMALGKIFIILGISEVLAWILTGLGSSLSLATARFVLLVIFTPALVGEIIILLMTIILYRRKARWWA